jgi:hypothetical protein
MGKLALFWDFEKPHTNFEDTCRICHIAPSASGPDGLI